MTVFTPDGSGTFTGPVTSVTAPRRGGRGSDGVALLAGGTVGDVAHRIDRLVRRAGGDDDAPASERLVAIIAAEERLGRGRDLERLGHAAEPASPLSAISPAFGPTTATPSAASRARLRRVAGCSHMRGFIAGAISTGRVGREQHRGGEVVRVAAGHLGHQVGGRGRHHDEVGLAREPDVADVELGRGSNRSVKARSPEARRPRAA